MVDDLSVEHYLVMTGGNEYEPAPQPNDEGRPDGRPSRSRSAGLQGSSKSYALVGRDSGGGIRTRDLRVMSPTSYQTAPPRVVLEVLAEIGAFGR